MAVDHVSYGGWANNLRLHNEHAELIVTLDVGPRVISYRTARGENVFKTFVEQLGRTRETEWQARGGHRFWLAPEDPVLSYIPDNGAVQHRVLAPLTVEFSNPPSDQLPIRKILTLSLAPDSTRVAVTHRAENHGTTPVRLATWGLSVMRPGGCEIIPLPLLGEHPRDLLPNRTLALWPYTSMADPRWHWDERFVTLRQADAPPTKLGLCHREHWVAYHNGDSLFMKEIEFTEGAVYPDHGCNFETFTNAEMLEVESLGPLTDLAPGAACAHTETWTVFTGVAPPPDNETELRGWISPYLPPNSERSARAQEG